MTARNPEADEIAKVRKEKRGEDEPILPANRAFVVQFGSRAAIGDEAAGRVEHVVSGRSARFATAERMLSFMREVLGDIDRERSQE